MAIDSEDTKFKSLSLPSLGSGAFSIDNSLKDKVIPHNYQSLIPIARNQIKHYINQIGYHPEKKSLYIEKINEIIINEFSHGRGFVKNE